jgi:hypothetical protein
VPNDNQTPKKSKFEQKLIKLDGAGGEGGFLEEKLKHPTYTTNFRDLTPKRVLAALAQSVERRTLNPVVGGSSPPGGVLVFDFF